MADNIQLTYDKENKAFNICIPEEDATTQSIRTTTWGSKELTHGVTLYDDPKDLNPATGLPKRKFGRKRVKVNGRNFNLRVELVEVIEPAPLKQNGTVTPAQS